MVVNALNVYFIVDNDFDLTIQLAESIFVYMLYYRQMRMFGYIGFTVLGPAHFDSMLKNLVAIVDGRDTLNFSCFGKSYTSPDFGAMMARLYTALSLLPHVKHLKVFMHSDGMSFQDFHAGARKISLQ